MDARERLDDDSDAAKVARLERSMLAAAPLAVVLVANDDPVQALGLVVARRVGHGAEGASEDVVDLHARVQL